MFSWNFPYPSQRMPVLAKNIVATSQPLAAQAGLAMLAKGGNAVDAGLAAAITLTVVEPTSNGIGSDVFAILWDGQRLVGLNASGRSPALWTPERFAGKKIMPSLGWDSVTVPGAVSAWIALSKRYGKLPFEDLFEAGIRYARESYMVSPITAASWANQAPNFKGFSEFCWTFLPKDRAPYAGERFYCPQMAETLEDIASSKGESFYRGTIAERIALASEADDGAMRQEDLAQHKADWVDPIAIDYRGYQLHEMPPNGQGIAALIALGILRNFDMSSIPVDSADCYHLQLEAMKLAFADVWRNVADPAAMKVTTAEMLGRRIPQGPREADRHEAGAGAEPRHPARWRDGLPHDRRREGHDAVVHPVELQGLRLRRGRARYRHQPAEPRCGLRVDARACRRGGTAQAAIPYDHPGIPHAQWPAGHELRRDGRRHAAAGSHPDDHPVGRLQPEPAVVRRRAALDRQPRHEREPRGSGARGSEGRAQATRPQHRRSRAADVRIRRRAAHPPPR
jgi:hypothetical protein